MAAVNIPNGIIFKSGVEANRAAYTPKLAEAIVVTDGAANARLFIGDGATAGGINPIDVSAFVAAGEKGAANGVATLDASGNLVQSSPLTIGSVDVVADDAARNALTVEEGDIAVVTASAGNGGMAATYAWDGAAWVELAVGSAAATFLTATDTPANYTGAGGQVLRVNVAANAIEFVALNATDLVFTPTGSITATTAAAAIAQVATLSTPTARTLTAGVGLAGGGDLSADRTFDVDINSLTAVTVDPAADFVMVHDTSGNAVGKALVNAVGVTTFVGLTDTPAAMGAASNMLAVNGAGNALEFVDAISGGTF